MGAKKLEKFGAGWAEAAAEGLALIPGGGLARGRWEGRGAGRVGAAWFARLGWGGGWVAGGGGQMGGAGDAEHAAEGAQRRVEGRVLGDGGAHRGIGQALFDAGAQRHAGIGFGFAGGGEAEQPGVMAGHQIGRVGAFGARAIKAGRLWRALWWRLKGAGEQIVEPGGHAGEAERNGIEQGARQPELMPAPDHDAAQPAHEGGEAERKTNRLGLVGHGCIRA